MRIRRKALQGFLYYGNKIWINQINNTYWRWTHKSAQPCDVEPLYGGLIANHNFICYKPVKIGHQNYFPPRCIVIAKRSCKIASRHVRVSVWMLQKNGTRKKRYWHELQLHANPTNKGSSKIRIPVIHAQPNPYPPCWIPYQRNKRRRTRNRRRSRLDARRNIRVISRLIKT